jgi:hypothetical protein
MTDDELDRALFALPLEEPPPHLHRAVVAVSTAPHAASRLAQELVTGLRAAGLFELATYGWLAVGLSSASCFSSLPFMATPRSTVYNR